MSIFRPIQKMEAADYLETLVSFQRHIPEDSNREICTAFVTYCVTYFWYTVFFELCISLIFNGE